MWKPISELTISDLKETPVWEWREDDTGKYVQLTALQSLTEYSSGPVHIAATRFTLGNGQVCFGYCSPAEASGLDYIQPVIIVEDNHVALWHEASSQTNHLAKVAALLNIDIVSLFPIGLECLIPVDGEYYRDEVTLSDL